MPFWIMTSKILNAIFERKIIVLKFTSKTSIDDRSALIQVMAWHQPRNMTLSQPMITQFSDA